MSATLVKLTRLDADLKFVTKPDRQTDANIAWATGWVHQCDTERYGIGAPHWYNKDGKTESELIGAYLYGLSGARLPAFTESLDAAKTIIGKPEDPFVYSIMTDFGGLHRVKIWAEVMALHFPVNLTAINISADGDSDALAFCKASIKTLLTLEQERIGLPRG